MKDGQGAGPSALCPDTTEHAGHERLPALRSGFRHYLFPWGLLQNLQTIKKPHQTAFLPFKLHDRSQSTVLKPSWELLGCNGKSSLGESPATGSFSDDRNAGGNRGGGI